VNIILPGKQGKVRWLSIDQGDWHSEAEIEIDSEIRLTSPSEGNWFALIQ
jgi:hypothetical protein